jgi:hypothetical protein
MNSNVVRRDQFIDFIRKELIGPDPIAGFGMTQENGEEILYSDPPKLRYIAGILFPSEVTELDALSAEEDVHGEGLQAYSANDDHLEDPDEYIKGESVEFMEDAEELINRSNAYLPSAYSITVAIKEEDRITVKVNAGVYQTDCYEEEDGNKKQRFLRSTLFWDNNCRPLLLPTAEKAMMNYAVGKTALRFVVTLRFQRRNYSIFTFTLLNTNKKTGTSFKDEDCYYQAKFHLFSKNGFAPLPEAYRVNTEDDDYNSNRLLYRHIKNYAVGHGCAADWEEAEKVTWVSTAVFPEYEVKPILPSQIPGVSLDMLKMSDLGDTEKTVDNLRTLCDKYEEWIHAIREEADTLEEQYKSTAERHIEQCKKCLVRLRDGIDLLEENEHVRYAFQLMNRAMLLQQLHYHLPLQRWVYDGNKDIRLENPAVMPDITDKTTWFNVGQRTYGQWRPFQIAFIVMNLRSMYEKDCEDRNNVDLIWFPTGGGKTEAYLGLSAYTIFLRRILHSSDEDDFGATILMRYTLRLLTAQQYERAASLICACETIRYEIPERLGERRITIGLWVGMATTPNRMADAIKQFNELYNKENDVNPFVILKCPWCGAQMGVVDFGGDRRQLPGYDRVRNKFIFVCKNEPICSFSSRDNCLPLQIIDEDIYENPPTVLLGTVDKFAVLPFRPQAQSIFGIRNGERISSPDLIIQDELHLISGPLGSMVGHYETIIYELCASTKTKHNTYPKIIASTATISRAKEQCHALYACGKDKVFQFPPPGLVAGDSFFAEERKDKVGRKYVGIFASGPFSDVTRAVRLYASMLYAAKAIDVTKESQRDPYWTNVGYYNSIRELGQAATLVWADIAQHLDTMYKRRHDQKRFDQGEYKRKRRYIYRAEELTSRIRSDRVTNVLANLIVSYPPREDETGTVIEHPIDICLATNMISVGLDVSRLGLMTVTGQPKTTSEYIQATSRIGRDASRAPGIVFVLYRPSRPRDKSYYEQFRFFHSQMHSRVEPTSVTPFSRPVRDRALHAIMITLLRQEGDDDYNDDPPTFPCEEVSERLRSVISDRVGAIDAEELNGTIGQMDDILDSWGDWNPKCWAPKLKRGGGYEDEVPLIYQAGNQPNESWGKNGFETPMSMRSVDATCEVDLVKNRKIWGD